MFLLSKWCSGGLGHRGEANKNIRVPEASGCLALPPSAARPENNSFLEHLWLFGSVARNEATDFSDLDLLYQPNVPLGLELMSLWDELETTFGCKVDLGDVRYVKPSLKASITKDLIDVF